MNRHGDKQASKLMTHTDCKPAAVCNHVIDSDLQEVLQANALPMNALPMSETESVLYSLARMVEQRDSHTAGPSDPLPLSARPLSDTIPPHVATLLSPT